MPNEITFSKAAARLLDPIARRTEQWAERVGMAWVPLVIMLAVLLSLALRFPPCGIIRPFYTTTTYGQAIIWWLDHPFSTIPVREFFPPEAMKQVYIEGVSAHCEKLAFRGTLPLINQITQGGFWTLIVGSWVGGVAILAIMYQVVWRETRDVVLASWSTWALAACFAGNWGFADFDYGDTVGGALMMGAMLTRPGLLQGLLYLAVAFSDERALAASSLVVVYHAWRGKNIFRDGTANGRPELERALRPFLVAVVAYVVIRLGLTFFAHVSEGNSQLATFKIISRNLSQPSERMVNVFCGLWLMPVLFILTLLAVRGWRSLAFWIYLGLMLLVGLPAFLVNDFERSLFFLLPGIALATALLPFELQEKRMWMALALGSSVVWSLPGSPVALLPISFITWLNPSM